MEKTKKTYVSPSSKGISFTVRKCILQTSAVSGDNIPPMEEETVSWN